MRIKCPFCGERGLEEFVYLGDAGFRRPDPEAPDAIAQYSAAVHLRDNPAGRHEELWYHQFGCRVWLQVTRDTRTHQVFEVAVATEKSGS
jgi:heterotetrameric sarcosine oxidase delta subunit